MKSLLGLVTAVFLALAMAGSAGAEEYIDTYASRIAVAADGTLTVTETIAANVEGIEFKRGIFRDFPLYARDADNRRTKVDFDLVSVERDGRPEPYRTESIDGGIRIYTGEAEVFLRPGLHTFTLTYTTGRQIRYFDDHDELYWNVTGTGWAFPIRRTSAIVELPDGARATDTTYYTGPEGSSEQDARQTGSASAPEFVTTRPLGPNEGLTIVVGLPKGIIAPPSAEQQRAWAMRDRMNIIISIAGLLVVVAYYAWTWNRVGRDPARGVVVPRWDPPDGLSPALVNYVDNRGFSGEGWTALSSGLINLAVKGYITLDDLKKSIVVTRTDKRTEPLPPGEAAIMGSLRGVGDTLVIDRENGVRVQSVGKSFRNAIEKEHRGKYYRANIGYIVGGVALSVLAFMALMVFGDLDPDNAALLIMPAFFGLVWGGAAVAAAKAFLRRRSILGRIFAAIGFAVVGFLGFCIAGVFLIGMVESIDTGEWPIFAAVGGITMANIVFFFLMGAPTPLGQKLTEGVEGLRIYLTLAEKDRMNMREAPDMSPKHFETLLPYAVALGVEKPWTKTFDTWLASAAAGAAAAAYAPAWYHGDSTSGFGDRIGGFSSSMASTIASTIPEPPKSSSSGFSSGGGFSGGGGGGGGGGGW